MQQHSSDTIETMGQIQDINTAVSELEQPSHTGQELPLTMQKVEINLREKSQEHQGNNQESVLMNLCKIVERSYSRHFVKALTFNFIQSLRKQKQQINQLLMQQSFAQVNKVQINWPFKELFQKTQRNQDQQQLFQFVNLCATMIQAKFKAFVARKRFVYAFGKAKKAKDLLSSFFQRWKVYRTFNCQKIVEIRKKIKQIQTQIDQEEQNFTNRDPKKIKALYKYSQIHNKMFQDTFKLLMQTGMWTLQKNTKPLRPPQKQNSRTRQRQMRGYREKAISHEEQPLPNQKQNVAMAEEVQRNQQPIRPIRLMKNNYFEENVENQSQKIESISKYSSGGLEDRPIKAAGQYKIDNEMIETPETASSKNIQNVSSASNIDEAQLTKIQERKKKAEQLQKRKKYDPRKAIEQEKKKKKEQKEQQGSSQPTEIVEKKQRKQEKSSTKIAKKQRLNTVENQEKPKNTSQLRTQPRNSQVSQKGIEKLNNSKVIDKKKVVSRVDCWGSKKEKQPEWIQTYKARILENQSQIRNDSSQKYVQSLPKSIEKPTSRKTPPKSRPTRVQQVEVVQKYDRYERAFQKPQKTSQNFQHAIQLEKLRQKQTQIQQRRNHTVQIEDQVRMIIERKSFAQPKKKQMHRPIEELQETYCKHYGERFRNLKPKLEFLTFSRNQERESQIPVLAEESQQFNEWFEQIYQSNQFWKKAAEHDRIYKSFVMQ